MRRRCFREPPQETFQCGGSRQDIRFQTILHAPRRWHTECISRRHDAGEQPAAQETQEQPMETKTRAGWMTALVALSVIVAALFILFLIMTAIGILD
jgi:hypothetical protein